MTIKEMNGNYHKVPNDIHKIVSSTYELSVLVYLLRCSNGTDSSFPSYRTIASNLMSRVQCIRTCQQLEQKGYIKINKRNFKSNIFEVNSEKIVHDINQITGYTSKPHKLVNKSDQYTTDTSKRRKPQPRIQYTKASALDLPPGSEIIARELKND